MYNPAEGLVIVVDVEMSHRVDVLSEGVEQDELMGAGFAPFVVPDARRVLAGAACSNKLDSTPCQVDLAVSVSLMVAVVDALIQQGEGILEEPVEEESEVDLSRSCLVDVFVLLEGLLALLEEDVSHPDCRLVFPLVGYLFQLALSLLLQVWDERLSVG